MIIVDYSGVAISNLFTMKMDPQENLVRHMILNSLRMYNVKYGPEYGEMVIACIDGDEVTLKRLYREGDRVRLQPSNPAMPPIIVENREVTIKGVVIGILRKYRRL